MGKQGPGGFLGLIPGPPRAANLGAGSERHLKGPVPTGQISMNTCSSTGNQRIRVRHLPTRTPYPQVTRAACLVGGASWAHKFLAPSVTQSVRLGSRPDSVMPASRWPWFSIYPLPGRFQKPPVSLPSGSGVSPWLT